MNPAQKILERLKRKKKKKEKPSRGISIPPGKEISSSHHPNAKAGEVKQEDALLP